MKCTVCAERDMKNVCHHCGRPLCTSNECDFQIHDPAFNDNYEGSRKTSAHHCLKCLETYHPDEVKTRAGRK